MNKTKTNKYKGDIYNGQFIAPKKRKEYQPEKHIIREFNTKTETYEYNEKIINHKLDWENELLGLQAEEDISTKGEK